MDDPFDLQRFVDAQAGGAYDAALQELRAGCKRGHWVWFVLPQLAGLGRSPAAQRYGVRSRAEARAYLAHPLLGPRLRETCSAVRALPDPVAALGPLDALKARSCLTLFEAATGDALFAEVLDRCYDGERDPLTLDLLAGSA